MSKNFTRILLIPVLFLLGISLSFAQTGNGLNFDGVKDYVSIPDNNLLDFGAGNFTIETWVNKKANSSGYNAGVVAKWNTGSFAGTNEWLLQTTSNGNDNVPSFWLESGTTIYQCNAVTPLVLNTWYHLAVVREGAALKIYVNGVLENTLPIPANTIINNKNLDLTLGAYRFSNNPIFTNMSMDELRIWSRALCQDEIINNKDCELVASGQTGLVALYHFNQGLAAGNNTGIVTTVADAPTITTVSPGDAQVTVAFTPPSSDGGAAITSYTVISNPGGISATGTSSPITVNELTNGVTYTFTVLATNNIGSSVASVLSAGAIPTGRPGAPAISSVTPGNAQVTVAFTPPASNGGLTITSYTVTSNPGGIAASGVTSPITVTGLTNGVTYTFTVAAANANGAGLPSAPSVNGATPTGPPSAPTNVVAAPGNTNATVSFTPPATNGGLTITSYTVVSTPGGVTAVGSGSPIVVAQLTNATSYTFTVKATNAAGSATSAASNAVVPATVPGAPRITAVAASSGKVTVTFSAPASNGGSAITGYKVTSSPGGITASGTASPIAVTGLTNGVSYTFVAVATNSIGSSISSASSTAIIPTGAPLPPTISTVTAGNAQVAVSFVAPTNNGGSPITSYVAVSTPGSFTATVTTVTPIIVTGLTNGQS